MHSTDQQPRRLRAVVRFASFALLALTVLVPRLSYAVTISATNSVTATRGATAQVTVSLDAASGSTVSIVYTTRSGTATEGVDYLGVNGTLTFNPGETSKVISISVLNNTAQPDSTTFTLAFSNPVGANFSGTSTTITIPTLPPTVTMPSTLTSARPNTVQVQITFSGKSSQSYVVAYGTSDLTAKAGVDYTSVSGSLTFAPGDTSKTIQVPVLTNASATQSSSFYFSITNSSAGLTVTNNTLKITLSPAAIRLGAVFSTTQSTSQSYIRLFNTDTAAGTATVTLYDSATGQSLGVWTSPSIAAGSEQQFGIGTLETGASVPRKPTYYTLSIQPGFNGYVQHVLYKPADGTLTNLSTCRAGATVDATRVFGVHSGLLATNFPSSIVVTNTSDAAQSGTLDIIDATSGSRLNTYPTGQIPAGGSAVILMTDIEAAAKLTPTSNQYHYVIQLESPFEGFLQHLVNNTRVGVITDMTGACRLAA